MQFLAVNWLAVLVATIINMVIGFLWYGPLFSDLFLRLIGKREEEIEGSPIVYLLGFVMGLVTDLRAGGDHRQRRGNHLVGRGGNRRGGVDRRRRPDLGQYHPVRGSTGRPVAAVSSYQLVVLTIAGVLFALWR